MTDFDDKVRFDKTINLGHILTMLSFLVIAAMQWNIMDKRIVVLEEFRLSQREKDVTQYQLNKDKFQEVRDGLNDLKHGMEKVADRIESKRR